MSSESQSPVTTPSKRSFSFIQLIVIAASVCIATSLMTVAVMSPTISPFASIHDSDGDGHPDQEDAFPDDPEEWADFDDDGVGDNSDEFPEDGWEWVDSDDDGYGDNWDDFPYDENEWTDSDEDGVGDNSDEFPDDPDEAYDSDGDHVGDNEDAFPDDPSETSDSDGDGVGDNADISPYDPEVSAPSGEFEYMISADYYYFDGISAYLANITEGVPWDEVIITFSDGVDVIAWDPSSYQLNSGTECYWYYGTARLGDIDILLAIVDDAGDGNLSLSDRLWLNAYHEQFRYYVDYTVSAVYEPTGDIIASCTVNEQPLYAPYISLDSDIDSDEATFTISLASFEVRWSDIKVTVSDSVNTVTWDNLNGDDLDDAPGDSQNYGSRILGEDVISLTVVDMDGNGFAGEDDYFVLNTDEFSDYIIYTLSLIFKSTDEIIAQEIFATDDVMITPTTQLTKTAITYGVKLTFAAVSKETPWSYIDIVISDGTDGVGWTNISSDDLDDGAAERNSYGSKVLGSLVIWLNITDLAGNGDVNQGDYITLTAYSFSAVTTYTVSVLYSPTASEMTHISFTG